MATLASHSTAQVTGTRGLLPQCICMFLSLWLWETALNLFWALELQALKKTQDRSDALVQVLGVPQLWILQVTRSLVWGGEVKVSRLGFSLELL